MHKRYLTVLAACGILSSCDSSTVIYGTVRIPIIKECEKQFVSHLSNEKWEEKVIWSIDRFTDPVATHHLPNLSGVLTINGVDEQFNQNEIMSHMVNYVLLDCYPTASIEVKLSELGSEFNQTLKFVRNHAKSKAVYLAIKQDKVIFNYNDQDTIGK